MVMTLEGCSLRGVIMCSVEESVRALSHAKCVELAVAGGNPLE
jgi:metal-sulfur cluster biosynthetic enzyme